MGRIAVEEAEDLVSVTPGGKSAKLIVRKDL